MDREKYIDESWKENAAQEKEKLAGKNAPEVPDEETFDLNFVNYVSSLGFQALIFLGELPNPLTQKTEKNLKQAKLLIDTLIMLREKTKGNLTPEEEGLLHSSIYELEMKFVQVGTEND